MGRCLLAGHLPYLLVMLTAVEIGSATSRCYWVSCSSSGTCQESADIQYSEGSACTEQKRVPLRHATPAPSMLNVSNYRTNARDFHWLNTSWISPNSTKVQGFMVEVWINNSHVTCTKSSVDRTVASFQESYHFDCMLSEQKNVTLIQVCSLPKASFSCSRSKPYIHRDGLIDNTPPRYWVTPVTAEVMWSEHKVNASFTQASHYVNDAFPGYTVTLVAQQGEQQRIRRLVDAIPNQAQLFTVFEEVAEGDYTVEVLPCITACTTECKCRNLDNGCVRCSTSRSTLFTVTYACSEQSAWQPSMLLATVLPGNGVEVSFSNAPLELGVAKYEILLQSNEYSQSKTVVKIIDESDDRCLCRKPYTGVCGRECACSAYVSPTPINVTSNASPTTELLSVEKLGAESVAQYVIPIIVVLILMAVVIIIWRLNSKHACTSMHQLLGCFHTTCHEGKPKTGTVPLKNVHVLPPACDDENLLRLVNRFSQVLVSHMRCEVSTLELYARDTVLRLASMQQHDFVSEATAALATSDVIVVVPSCDAAPHTALSSDAAQHTAPSSDVAQHTAPSSDAAQHTAPLSDVAPCLRDMKAQVTGATLRRVYESNDLVHKVVCVLFPERVGGCHQVAPPGMPTFSIGRELDQLFVHLHPELDGRVSKHARQRLCQAANIIEGASIIESSSVVGGSSGVEGVGVFSRMTPSSLAQDL
ncbi:PREDICTED: uncharacterized protein LOC106811107 isoform X2 [Priapulus caudatus]|uniref:Uncharacterized protein LOC106811107 isoform X2 n=1 Tax=Priapulus caudatus TaxID=37621 RepID=A0ABM1ED58_PRICU|nr:PREDICTED: uncharacterized protein LOC106811107 isoform X2 [Priapulus caudatus]